MFVETAYYVEGRPMSGIICGSCGAELTVQETERDTCGICSWRISTALEAKAQEEAAVAAVDPDQLPWPEEALLW